MKKRIIGLDILRDIGVIFIFCYHFTVEYIITAGGTMTFMAGLNYIFNILARPASLFLFVISGFALMYNHEDQLPLLDFYKRRFKGLLLPFYVAYTLMFVANFMVNNQVVGNGIPLWRFLFTLCGVDGVMQLKCADFYLIGEWFMTCIVFCYLVFPLLARLLKKCRFVVLAVMLVWYFVLLFVFNPFGFSQLMNPLFIVLYFYLGMLLQQLLEKKQVSKPVTVVCGVFSILVWIYYFLCGYNSFFANNCKVSQEISELICIVWSLAMIIAFMKVELNPDKKLYKAITYISGISWYIILLHHRIMILFYSHYSVENYTKRDLFGLFLACTFITWFAAVVTRDLSARLKKAIFSGK